MARHTLLAALAIAWLGCTPIAAPTRPPEPAAPEPTRPAGQAAPERILDASLSDPDALLPLDCCPSGPEAAQLPDSDEPPPSESIDLAKADAIRDAFFRQLPEAKK